MEHVSAIARAAGGSGAFAPDPSGASPAGDPSTLSVHAIDGAHVSVDGLPAAPRAASSQAAFVLPSTRRGQVFRAHRAGFTDELERWVADPRFGVEVRDRKELSSRGGRLRVASVHQQTRHGGRSFVFAAWEGRHGSIVTSRQGRDIGPFAQQLVRLPFEDRELGCTLALPLETSARPPTVMLHAPGIGLLFVRPHSGRVLEQVPRTSGARTAGGELFRQRAARHSLLLVTPTAVVDIEAEPTTMAVDAARALRITWRRGP